MTKQTKPNRKTKNNKGNSSNTGKNIPLDINEHPLPTRGKATVQEIITDDKPIVPAVVSPSKQRQLEALEPFKWSPGQSGNPSGRPKDKLKALGLRIAQLQAGKILKPKELEYIKALGLDTADLTLLEAIMVQLATSKNPAKIEMYLQRTFGNVPNININAQVNETIVERFKSKFTDDELERIAGGEDAAEILFDKLPNVDGADSTIVDADVQDAE